MDRMTQPTEAATRNKLDLIDARWAVAQITGKPDAAIRRKPGFIERFLLAIAFTGLVVVGGIWLAVGIAVGFGNIRLRNEVIVFGGICLMAIIASYAAQKSKTN